jgi:hypothetical protein
MRKGNVRYVLFTTVAPSLVLNGGVLVVSRELNVQDRRATSGNAKLPPVTTNRRDEESNCYYIIKCFSTFTCLLT